MFIRSILFTSLVFFLSFITVSYGDKVTDGTELIMAFLIHRHGDRTPIENTLQFAEDLATLEELIQPYGYGQLTVEGKNCAYNLGKYIRQRYNVLLSSTYNQTDIYIKSSDSARTKMTVLAAMAAVYPAEDDPYMWHDKINWVPIPYDSMALRNDPDLFVYNCPKFINYSYNMLSNSDVPEMSKFNDLLLNLSKEINIDITKTPLKIYIMYDLLVSQQALGMTLSESIQALLPQIEEAAGVAIDVLYGNNDFVPLESGVLLKEFLDEASNKLLGKDTPSVRIHSAHDTNVHSFRTITQLKPKLGVPKYGAAISLELRKVLATGQTVVLPVYKPSPEEEELYLQVDDCELLCDFKQFKKKVEGSTRSYDKWRQECEYTADFVIDRN